MLTLPEKLQPRKETLKHDHTWEEKSRQQKWLLSGPNCWIQQILQSPFYKYVERIEGKYVQRITGQYGNRNKENLMEILELKSSKFERQERNIEQWVRLKKSF